MKKYEILYEDNHLLVVFKYPGILSQEDITKDDDLLSLLKKYIKEKYQKPGNVYLALVHRLDRMVSGVMVFAKTSKAAARLSKDFSDNKIIKKYMAVCHNNFKEKKGKLISKIIKKDKMAVSSANGKEAILDFEVIDETKEWALVDINLKTGRYNQIRFQMAENNTPIYADHKYGLSEKGNIALTAYYLSFMHPVLKKDLNFSYMINQEPFNIFKQISKE